MTPCRITPCPCQKPLSSSLAGLSRYWQAALRSPWSILCSRLKSPSSPSLSTYKRCSGPWIITVAFSDPAPTGPGLSCAEGSRAGHRTPGGSRQSGAEGQNPLPHPAAHAAGDAAQGPVGLLGCQCGLLGHVQLFIHQYSQVLLLRAALHPFSTQPVFVVEIGPTQMQDLSLGLFELHEVHMAHISSLSRSLCMASLPSNVLTAPHSLVSSTNLLRVHSIPLSMSLTKILNDASPNIDP